MADIASDIFWARFSQKYFGKSASWIYNKINEIDGNGGQGRFTRDETEQLQFQTKVEKREHQYKTIRSLQKFKD